MRPKPWTPKPVPTVWLDYKTGRGVTDAGEFVQAQPGDRRQMPNLTDKLQLAASLGAKRIMFVGDVPKHEEGKRHWLLVKTPGFTPGKHWLGSWMSVTGRYTHDMSGADVTVKIAAEWFGDMPLKPEEARVAWQLTEGAMRAADPKATLFLSPSFTGANLWALSLPRNVEPVHVEHDIAELLRNTSGQHHVEHLVAGPNLTQHDDVLPLVQPTQYLHEFGYVDGRFMYSAVCREIGIGPVTRLRHEDACELLDSHPYARARYYVRFTVPEGWNHIGILAVKAQGSQSKWIYPNRPGATHETWADSSEVFVARMYGWKVYPLEAIKFSEKVLGIKNDGTKSLTTARPLDTFADRMVRARERVTENLDIPDAIRAAVAAALRAILLQTIGGFHSPGRESTVVVDSLGKVPPRFQSTVQEHGEVWSYRVPTPNSEASMQYFHPEFSTQIWGRARARLLSAPAAGGHKAGVLTLDPSTVLGVYGDAVYTSQIPMWSLPTSMGGGDDGKVGRLRLQGEIRGRFQFPVTLEQRDKLRTRASKAGLEFLKESAA